MNYQFIRRPDEGKYEARANGLRSGDMRFLIYNHRALQIRPADSENREITLKIGREVGMDIWKEDRIEKKLTFNRITETRFLEFKDEKKEKHTGRKNE